MFESARGHFDVHGRGEVVVGLRTAIAAKSEERRLWSCSELLSSRTCDSAIGAKRRMTDKVASTNPLTLKQT